MNEKTSENSIPDCSTAGKGFARTENRDIASESCGLPARGFGKTDFGQEAEAAPKEDVLVDCSTAGMGFAHSDRTKIAPENCAFPTKGFGTTDFGKEK